MPPRKSPTKKPSPKPATGRYVVVLYQGLGNPRDAMESITSDVVTTLRHALSEAVTTSASETEIDVWLESPGGDAHAAYKLGLLLRAHTHRLRVIVPDYAKSAATLLALAADEIFMAPAAELGPLDAQIPREDAFVPMISALDIARSLDDLANQAFELAMDKGAEVLDATRLTRVESLTMALDFSAKFMEPIVRQLDPTMLHWSSTLLDVASAYAVRLLQMREGGATRELANLPYALVGDYPTHGFVISRSEAEERLHLPVFDLEKYDLAELACALHKDFERRRARVIEVRSLNDAPTNPEEGDHD